MRSSKSVNLARAQKTIALGIDQRERAAHGIAYGLEINRSSRAHATPATALIQRSNRSLLPIRWRELKSIFEQELLYAGAHHEIEELLRDTKGCLPTGPHHRSPELDRRIRSGRGFI